MPEAVEQSHSYYPASPIGTQWRQNGPQIPGSPWTAIRPPSAGNKIVQAPSGPARAFQVYGYTFIARRPRSRRPPQRQIRSRAAGLPGQWRCLKHAYTQQV